MSLFSHSLYGRLPAGFVYVVWAFAIITGISICYQMHLSVFDDAYISFRYAQNLAEHGQLTWNVNGEHAEGYSNLLLILLLALGIKLFLAPLLFARIISFLSLFIIGYSFCRCLRLKFGIHWKAGSFLFILYVFSTQALQLCMVGMETVLSAALLSLFILIATRLLQAGETRERKQFLAQLYILSLLALLTRPENGLLLLPLLFLSLDAIRRQGLPIKNVLVLFLWWWMLPTGIYLLWKMYYYGDILPLPFYVKVLTSNATAAVSLIKPSGVSGLTYTIASHKWLFLCATGGFLVLLSKKDNHRWLFVLSGIFLLFNLYFCTVDILMNIYNRFFFPFLIILFLLIGPLIVWIPAQASHLIAGMKKFIVPGVLATWSVLLAVVLFAYRNEVLNTAHGIVAVPGKRDLMQRELAFARQLSEYPKIKNISIAFSDAGVLAYYTRADFIDLVGLNNNIIAKGNKAEALAYVFNSKPVLLIAPSLNNQWITFGHGQLGNYNSWIKDPRLDAYSYIATITTTYYNLELLLWKDYPGFNNLGIYLSRISDTVYRTNGLTFGLRSSCVRDWQ